MSQRDAEIERLKSRIDAMQETLAHRENEMETKHQAPKGKTHHFHTRPSSS